MRRLAAELRRLRSEAGLSREQVESQTGVNEGTLYRVETARARPQRRTLTALLDLYGADEAVKADLLEVARSSGGQGWSRPYDWQLPGEYAAYISFEAEARAVHNYESLFIPGLLQTPDYGRAMVQGVLPNATAQEVEQRVQTRAERQKLLDAENPLELWAVMDEAAIRRRVGGPQVMAGQLDHMAQEAQRPNITVQVITFGSGAHPGMPGSFAHMDFRDDLGPDLVYVDTLAGDIFLETDDDIHRYRSMFERLRAIALSPAETIRLIVATANSLKGG
jgi:transcriptional regulator with XRE-family HTH domain